MRKTKNVPMEVWDADINRDELGYYMFILDHSFNFGYANFSNLYAALKHKYSQKKVQRMTATLRNAKLIKTDVIDNRYRKIYPLYFGETLPVVDITTLRDSDGSLIHTSHSPINKLFEPGFSLPDWSKTLKFATPNTDRNCPGDKKERTEIVPTLQEQTKNVHVGNERTDKNCPSYYNTIPTVSLYNTKYSNILRSNISIITKDNNPNITQQNLDKQNFDAETFFVTMQKTLEQMNDNILFLNRRLIQNNTKATEDGVGERSFDAVRPTPPVCTTGKPLAKAKKDRGSGDGQTIEQQIKNMPKPKETKAVKMKRWNEENWYRLFADPEAGNTDAMRMMRIILVKYPEIMSLTNYLKLEDADLLLKQYELEDISYALSYLNGFAGRNKYDNVLGAIQTVIANKKAWAKK